MTICYERETIANSRGMQVILCTLVCKVLMLDFRTHCDCEALHDEINDTTVHVMKCLEQIELTVLKYTTYSELPLGDLS